jgi:IS1 family transposase
MNTLPPDKKLTIISSLLEGNSVRSTERMTGVHRDTICRLLVQVGDRSTAVLDGAMQNLRCGFVQCDEIWCYVGKKDRHIPKDERSPEIGSQWVFVAMDEETKLVPCYLIGKRSRETTIAFLWELKKRLNAVERFQITTDGYHFYRSIQGIFAGQADFAQLIKCLATLVSMTVPKRGTPHQESRRLYPRWLMAGRMRTASARHT